MKAYKLEVLIIDHEDAGIDEIQEMVVNGPINLNIMSIASADIGEWSDDHPLNKRETHLSEFRRLFGDPDNMLDRRIILANLGFRVELLKTYQRNIHVRFPHPEETHAYELKVLDEKIQLLDILITMLRGSNESIEDTTSAISKIHGRVKESGTIR